MFYLCDDKTQLTTTIFCLQYPTLTHDTVQYILEHSGSKLLFVGKLDEHPWNEMKSGVPADMDKVSFPLCPGK